MISSSRRLRLRPSEWLLIGFFAYVAAISLFFRNRPHVGLRPLLEFIVITAALMLLPAAAKGRRAAFVNTARDWLPLLWTLLAFHEMELFLPATFSGKLEAGWIRFDRILLNRYHLRAALESLGPVIPLYLEICYFLVYGVAAASIGILYKRGKRKSLDRFWTIYLTGTLLAYSLFPYFPSQPPRIAFAGLDNPMTSCVRRLNVFILNAATIHVGVFPSAHVSSAFACAWAMFLLIPERKSIGWGLLIYAASVSIATIYGRYHYTADVVAGFAISLVPAALAIFFSTQKIGREL